MHSCLDTDTDPKHLTRRYINKIEGLFPFSQCSSEPCFGLNVLNMEASPWKEKKTYAVYFSWLNDLYVVTSFPLTCLTALPLEYSAESFHVSVSPLTAADDNFSDLG